MFEGVDFKTGKVIYSDDDNYLKEDLLQVEYQNGYILDIGWYGEENGFTLCVVKDFDWEKVLLKYSVDKKEQMIDLLQEMISKVMELSRQ